MSEPAGVAPEPPGLIETFFTRPSTRMVLATLVTGVLVFILLMTGVFS